MHKIKTTTLLAGAIFLLNTVSYADVIEKAPTPEPHKLHKIHPKHEKKLFG